MTSPTYFEAYTVAGPRLGNLDGQYIHRGPNYERTAWYKALQYQTHKRPQYRNISHWLVVRDDKILERIDNVHYKEPLT